MRNVGIHVSESSVNVIVRTGTMLEFARVFDSMDEVRSLVEKLSAADNVRVAQTLPHYLSAGSTQLDFDAELELLFPDSRGSKYVEKVLPLNGTILCGVYDIRTTVLGEAGRSSSHVVALAAIVANDMNPCTMVNVEEDVVEVFDMTASGVLTRYTSARWSDARDIIGALDGRTEAVFAGNALRRDVLEDVRRLANVEALRLNAFGLMETALPLREREYCSRTSHLFGAAVGATLLK